MTIALGRKSPRWALGCVPAAVFVIARVCALWAQTSEYNGFLHPPSLKSLVLLIAVAVSAGSGALAVAVVIRGDLPLLRIQSNIVKKALITGAMLSLANVVTLQWTSPYQNFLSVNTVGFHAGIPVTVALTLLVVALLYALALVGGAICGPEAAVAVAATIAGAWAALLADGTSTVLEPYSGSTWPGIGFVFAAVSAVTLVLFIRSAMRVTALPKPIDSPQAGQAFPYVSALRTAIAVVAGYVLLLWPIHSLTTAEATLGHLVVAGIGIVLVGSSFTAAWIASPRLVDMVNRVATASTPTPSA